jgi:hypothetical protein
MPRISCREIRPPVHYDMSAPPPQAYYSGSAGPMSVSSVRTVRTCPCSWPLHILGAPRPSPWRALVRICYASVGFRTGVLRTRAPHRDSERTVIAIQPGQLAVHGVAVCKKFLLHTAGCHGGFGVPACCTRVAIAGWLRWPLSMCARITQPHGVLCLRSFVLDEETFGQLRRCGRRSKE